MGCQDGGTVCGYRKEKGMNTNKIMRILNAMYNYMTEKNGVEPFPTNVFLERKEIIKEMSRRDNKMEDVFATTRNGRQLVDFYDPDTNTLDIRSNGLYPSGEIFPLDSPDSQRLMGSISNLEIRPVPE